jgi:EsV-1-7 cysteine-rich motif
MVDTSYRRCEAAACGKAPMYAYEGEKARFCSAHREPGMIDVSSSVKCNLYLICAWSKGVCGVCA